MALEIVELGVLRRVTQLLHSGDCFARTVEIAGMRSSERVTIFDQGLHEWEQGPVREGWNSQRRCRSPIISLKCVTCRNGCQRVSRAEFQFGICLSHLRRKIDNLFGLTVPRLLQIR